MRYTVKYIQEILDINEYEYDLEVLARQMNEFEKK